MIFGGPEIEEKPTKRNSEHHFKDEEVPLWNFVLELRILMYGAIRPPQACEL